MFDLSGILRDLSILVVPFLTAITFHEVAHGYVAYRLGDPTAKNEGRLTLNPLKHLDVMGTLVLVLTRMIGWAKPVPIDPRYFRDPRKGMIYVSLAGVTANFILALVFAAGFRAIMIGLSGGPTGIAANILVPLAYMCQAGVMINLVLGIFNLIPIPPLDGSKVLAGILPPHMAMSYLQIERYGFLIIILLVFLGVIEKILIPVLNFFQPLLLGM
ncbi:MAG: site-2 protease family protein [Desulfovibrionales bacterium]